MTRESPGGGVDTGGGHGGGGGGGASRSQSALHMHVLVCICSNVRQFDKITSMIQVCYHTIACSCCVDSGGGGGGPLRHGYIMWTEPLEGGPPLTGAVRQEPLVPVHLEEHD